ncbi:MAG: hypothetical protein LBE49_06505 [Deltaproteobacteria bacterium]|jgi:16S rRNA (cytosine967-C5)-methyltransferase|nr:hypothetical protein [Deltaproteobacteria bacterium]
MASNLKIRLYDDPLQTALDSFLDVESGRRPEEALASRWALLDQKGRALASALVYETVRHKSRLERLVSSALKRGRAEPGLMSLLMMSAARLVILEGAPDYAVVDSAVELAKKRFPGRASLVNAVLRKLLSGKGEGVWPFEPAPSWADTPARRLSLFYSYPYWLSERLVFSLGLREARAVMAAGNQTVPPTLRVNPLKTSREELKKILGFPAAETRFSPWGLSPEKFQGPPETWPGFAQGLFSIQDEASQILGLMLNSPGSVLDACAGLGGKTTLMATLLPEARIVAVDPDGRKLSALGQEAARLGLKRAPETCKSILQQAPLNGELFDLVVVDAPCSGLGVIRRRPDLKWVKKEADLPRHQAFQLELLSSASEKAAKGGRLIYCVCTFAPEEGPEVVEKFLASSKGAFRLLGQGEIPELLRPLLCQPGCLRLWTHRHGTDGFFYALLARV